jgi:cell wall-associated NlpC family hydrolase
VSRRIRLLLCAALMLVLVPASSAGAAQFAERDLRVGAKGKDVKTAQRYLTRSGIKTAVDGHYGYATARAVKRWERRQAYLANGRLTISEQKAMAAQASGAAGYAEPDDAPEDKPAPVEKATIGPDGLAVAPASAPEAVKAIIAAGNKIHSKPYRYGGGHGRWNDTGYDCSGSMSYALHGADLLDTALDSTGFMSWGRAGKGRWVTTYAHGGHAYMVVAGLRFDTSAHKAEGSRWSTKMRSSSGYTIRHPKGL